MTTAQDGGKVVSLTHRPSLPPENAPVTVLFLLTAIQSLLSALLPTYDTLRYTIILFVYFTALKF